MKVYVCALLIAACFGSTQFRQSANVPVSLEDNSKCLMYAQSLVESIYQVELTLKYATQSCDTLSGTCTSNVKMIGPFITKASQAVDDSLSNCESSPASCAKALYATMTSLIAAQDDWKSAETACGQTAMACLKAIGSLEKDMGDATDQISGMSCGN